VTIDALGTLLELPDPAPFLRAELAQRFGVEVTDEEASRGVVAEIAHYRAHMREGVDMNAVGALRRDCAAVLRSELPAAARKLSVEQVGEALLASLRFRAFPDVRDALEALRAAGLRLVVLSNWDASLPDTLSATGLAELVDGWIASASLGASKADPAVFERALELAGCAAAETVHVGDSIDEDVLPAIAAGVRPVLVARWGVFGEVPDGVPVVDSLAGVPALVT
jgi:putative hydrolase of the HAD superfamily